MHFHEYTSFPFRIQVFFGEICGWGKRKRTAREGDAAAVCAFASHSGVRTSKEGCSPFCCIFWLRYFFETSDTLLSLSARSRKKLNCTHRRRVPLPRLGFALWRMVVWAASRCVFRLILIKFPACRAERYFGKFF